MTSIVGILRACRIRPGRHVVQITRADVESAVEFFDLSIRELLNESLRAQHAGDARRGHLLTRAAIRRYERSLEIAREAA